MGTTTKKIVYTLGSRANLECFELNWKYNNSCRIFATSTRQHFCVCQCHAKKNPLFLDYDNFSFAWQLPAAIVSQKFNKIKKLYPKIIPMKAGYTNEAPINILMWFLKFLTWPFWFRLSVGCKRIYIWVSDGWHWFHHHQICRSQNFPTNTYVVHPYSRSRWAPRNASPTTGSAINDLPA